MLIARCPSRFISSGRAGLRPSHLRKFVLTAVPTKPLIAEDQISLPHFPSLNAITIPRVRQDLLSALEENRITSLTEIQEKAIPAISNKADVLIASHTGSGKTLAYLLPLVNRLKALEEEFGRPKPKKPRAVVLAPTRELSDQILCVAKLLSHHAKFSSMSVSARVKPKIQKRLLSGSQDLVVATPSELLKRRSEGDLDLADVQLLVLDEADTMFDDLFILEVTEIVSILRRKERECQFVLVAATATKVDLLSSIPPIAAQEAKRKMKQLFPEMAVVETSTLHKGVSGCIHSFVILKPGQDKIRLLREVLAEDVRKEAKVMVFCNTQASCRCIDHELQEHNIPTLCYHGELPKADRRDIIDQFAGVDNEGHVLVCTDVAARGLDIPGRVDHIINFDFPTSPVGYLHRSGRTARAGANGKVTSLVTGRDRVLADRIKWAVEHDLPLSEISHIKSHKPPSLRKSPSRENRRPQLKGLRGAKRHEALESIARKNQKEQQSAKRR